ncbi:MAG: sigma-70 family RNA polymerase sigma factor [Actinobacteria bacterium]|nr:sigma-70 family RNA polymerase sigma factor [Actinomycetota bacterium]
MVGGEQTVAVRWRRAEPVTADLEAFCTREYPRLVAALHLYCGDRHVAEDLAQETLVRVWDRWPRVSRLQSPGGWCHRVALNLARSHLRRRTAEGRANRRSHDPATDVARDADVADNLAVAAALASLTPRQREVLILRYYLGHSVVETAALLDLPEGTVKSHSTRAIAALRHRFGVVQLPGEER